MGHGDQSVTNPAGEDMADGDMGAEAQQTEMETIGIGARVQYYEILSL